MCIYTVKMKKNSTEDSTEHQKIGGSFAVSFTPETPNFGTFGGVTHSP